MPKKNILLKINVITLGSVFVLILVGSIVRSLGAGMGCPDWPKCFGEYIPPTSDAELPDNYLDIFRSQRIEKNERLARTLSVIGYTSLAEKILNDPAVQVEQEFSVTKAWIEYINRLVGVLIGLLVFLNMVFSLTYWKRSKLVPILGISIFVLTGFQGWIGSLVVSTNLLHGFITFHMVVALLIVALLIWMNVLSKDHQPIRNTRLSYLSLIALLIFIPQIFLGTDVRGIIDDLIFQDAPRSTWSSFLETNSFYIHRSYSWLILLGTITIFYFVQKEKILAIKPTARLLFGLVIVAMFAGVGMTKLEFAFWLQPLHLILGTGIFSLLFYLNLRFKKS